MKTKSIAILFGGKSSEYEVSLQSAGAILKHFPYEKYNLYLIGITKQGEWYHYQGSIEKILNDTWHYEKMNRVNVCLDPNYRAVMEIKNEGLEYHHLDALLPVLHGKNGEDGTVQGLLELANIPIIGCGLLSSALCMDKLRAHEIVKGQGIKVAPGVIVTKNDNVFEKVFDLHFPMFVKPLKAGSSYGISKVFNHQELNLAVLHALNYDSFILVEEEIPGFEVGCAVIGNDELQVGLVDEIELSGEFFDYKEKYTPKSSKIHLPARLDNFLIKKIQDTAMVIYRTLGCQTFARIDLFITPDNEIYFNEVNTIPGFTVNSRFPQMMKGIGYDFPKLIRTIIEMGLKHGERNSG